MTDISALQQALSRIVPDSGFVLDTRTILSELKFIEQYARGIPFGTGPDGEAITWSECLFSGGNTPEVLAALFQAPSLSDGQLNPHQAFLLALLNMLETPKAFTNYFPGAHRDLYYRRLLGLQERPAEPSRVAVGIVLKSSTPELMVPAGTLLDAGQDSQGMSIAFQLDENVLANQSAWCDLRWCRPATAGAGAGWSAIVYSDDRDWPDAGLRLFDASAQDQVLLTGRMLPSDLLTSGQTFTVALEAAVDSTQLTGQLSAGERWIELSPPPGGAPATTLVFTLPEGADPIGAPNNLPGTVFDQPVFRLSRRDGQPVPALTRMTIYDGSANIALSVSEQVVMTPFGHAVEAQPVGGEQLCLGIRDLLPGQTLSLFWALNSPRPLTVSWQYLTQANNWQSLEHVLDDGTQGLTRRGLWSVILPADASNTATSMPAGCYWFRALVDPVPPSDELSGVASYPWLSGIVTNGMTATLKNVTELDSAVVATPLPANTLRQPVSYVNGLSQVTQPWASWGGRPKESTDAFVRRAAERLSHRDRALTWSDMVMILKTEFPYVFDVMTPSGDILTTLPALTTQTLVVIPLVSEKDNDDALRPRFNAARLATMGRTLQDLASPWQDIRVVNPSYRDVVLDYEVVFSDGVNPLYAGRALRQALEACYMPWSVGAAGGVTLARRIDYYGVLAQIQQQPGVDHVVSLTLDGQSGSVQGSDDEVLILRWSA